MKAFLFTIIKWLFLSVLFVLSRPFALSDAISQWNWKRKENKKYWAVVRLYEKDPKSFQKLARTFTYNPMDEINKGELMMWCISQLKNNKKFSSHDRKLIEEVDKIIASGVYHDQIKDMQKTVESLGSSR